MKTDEPTHTQWKCTAKGSLSVHCRSLDKCVVTRTYHDSISLSSFTAYLLGHPPRGKKVLSECCLYMRDQWSKLSYLLFQHLIELLWISGSSHPFIICHSWCQTNNFHGKSGKKMLCWRTEMSQYFLIGKTTILLFCIIVPTASLITFRLWKLYLSYIKVKSQQTWCWVLRR